MARPDALPAIRLSSHEAVERRSRRPSGSQARAAAVVARFLAVSLVWILVSGAILRLAPNVGHGAKALADVAFLGFATLTMYGRVLRALTAAERSELAYRAASVELIERLSIVGEHRDDLTGGHARRIGAYAGCVGTALGLDKEACERLELAATLHDLGKVGIPDAILNKTGPLTEAERDEMETHVAIGARMLDGGTHPLIRTAHLVALTHHENWDGSGYPQGLRGEDIPMVGRIVAVCDVYDALVSARSYKAAWSSQEALAEIERLAGSKFDPAVVTAFLECQGVGIREESSRSNVVGAC